MRFFRAPALPLVLLMCAAGCTSQPKAVRTAALGDKAEIGPFIYQAFETRWPITLPDRTPRERFFIVRISVVNSGATTATVPSFEVLDDSGKSYPELSDGSGVEKWLGLSRKLTPGETEQGSIVFDVPPKHYRLRVADESDNFMYIDVPLSLISEEPDRSKIDAVNPR